MPQCLAACPARGPPAAASGPIHDPFQDEKTEVKEDCMPAYSSYAGSSSQTSPETKFVRPLGNGVESAGPHYSSVQTGPAAEEMHSVDEQAVQTLFGPAAGAAPQDLVGTGLSYRHDWGDRNGQWKLNLSWGAVSASSRIFVSIGEGAPGGGKQMGAARYTLHNVTMQNGVVSIWVNIEWGSPIRLYVDYLVIN